MSDRNGYASASPESRGKAAGRITRSLLAAVTTAALLWALGACGTPAPQATVTGTVTYPQPAEAGPGTVLIVQIQDLSTGGDPAMAGEQTIPDPGPVPVAFAVPYDPGAIDQGHDYVVHARVEDGEGNLLYVTMQPYAVITLGHPTESIQVTLEPVGGATPAQ